MNALQLVNSVLRRLREEQVTDFTASYTNLILDFINETKREVEDSWNWTALRQVLTITTSNGVNQYSLTGAGERFRFLPREGTDNIFAYDSTNHTYLHLGNGDFVNKQAYLQTVQATLPEVFAVVGQDSSFDPILKFYPTPNGTYSLKFGVVVPQAELTTITDVLTVPWYPVVLGAWAKAISERGEDGGQNSAEQDRNYYNSLGDAIQMDAAKVGETVWQQV